MSIRKDLFDALVYLSTPFWYANAVVPSIIVVGSVVLRAALNRTLSAGTDALLAVATFDAVAISSGEEFKMHMAQTALRSQAVQVHGLLLALAAFAWFFFMKWGEPALARQPPLAIRAWLISLGGLCAFAVLVFVHVVAYRGPA